MTTHSNSLSGWFRRKHQSPDEADQVQDELHSASTTSGGSDQEPVVVWEAANRMEAEIIQGRLESENIPAFVRGEALGAIYGLTTGGLATAEVLVPAPLADKALEILSADVEWIDESDEVREEAAGDEEAPDRS